MDPTKIIAALNSLGVGDLGTIRDRVAEARRACLDLEYGELVEQLDEAAAALDKADLKTYRKRVQTVVARLGHLR